MCARLFYFLLAALFVFVVVTVAAFVYLQWWQAILASTVTFILCVLATQWMVKSTFRQFTEMAKEAMSGPTRVLRGATADVHSVKFTDPPREAADTGDLQPPRWYLIEVTIFPDPQQAKPTDSWSVYTLSLVPSDPRTSDEDTSGPVELYDMQLLTNGVAADPRDGIVTGPQRLRFVAGVPREVRAVQFAYGFERFGLIRLPQALPGASR